MRMKGQNAGARSAEHSKITNSIAEQSRIIIRNDGNAKSQELAFLALRCVKGEVLGGLVPNKTKFTLPQGKII